MLRNCYWRAFVKRLKAQIITLAGSLIATIFLVWHFTSSHSVKPQLSAEQASIVIDYPLQGSISPPPEFPPPTMLWRDPEKKSTFWELNIIFSDGTPSIRVQSAGEPMQIGECDPRCIAPTNKLPSLTPEQAQAHTWIPDSITWASIKEHSVSSPVKIVIIGYPDSNSQEILSSGQVSIQTSCDSFKKIVDSRPDNAEAHRNLGHAMAERGDLQHASKHLELAVRFSYEKDPLAMYLLGRVYADLGKFKRAVEIDLKAIFIANQMNNQVLADAIRGHLHQLSQYQ